MHRAYFPQNINPGARVQLSADESHHLIHVMRLDTGSELEITNGLGQLGRATIVQASARGCEVKIESLVTDLPDLSRVHLAFAIPKPAALEFIIRRCTEVGVASFQPLVTDHCLHMNHWNENRWTKILIEVGKQCQSPYFPKIQPPKPLAEWLNRRDGNRSLLFCNELERQGQTRLADDREFEILTGAEGGWSEREIKMIESGSYHPLGLGSNRLRTEMAALVAVILIKSGVGEIR